MPERLGQATKLLGAILVALAFIIWIAREREAPDLDKAHIATEDAGLESKAVARSFDQCLGTIRQMGSRFGIAPINVVETNELRMVRFCVSDGSVLVSCSRPDQKMVVTRSLHRSGCS